MNFRLSKGLRVALVGMLLLGMGFTALMPFVDPLFIVKNSSGTTLFYIEDTGDVGIGTATPNARLEVNGNIIADSPTADNHVVTKSFMDANILSQPATIAICGSSQSGTCSGGWVTAATVDGVCSCSSAAGSCENGNGNGECLVCAGPGVAATQTIAICGSSASCNCASGWSRISYIQGVCSAASNAGSCSNGNGNGSCCVCQPPS